MSKVPKSIGDYKLAARNLKKAGQLNIDLRKKLTPALKGKITKAVNSLPSNYRTLAYKPDQFFTIKAPSVKTAKLIEESGYLRNGKSVFMRHKKGFSNYRFEGDELVFEEATNNKNLYYEVRNYFPGTEQFYEFSRKLRDGKLKLKKGEVFTMRIGGNSPFQGSYFQSLEDFIPYLQKMQQGTNLKESTFEEILPHLQFVKLKYRKG